MTLVSAAALAAGCAKGEEFDRDGLVYLDPRLPTPAADASAEGGPEPPQEVPPTPTDAGSPPAVDPPLDAGDDGGDASAPPDAGADAALDGG
jgi:hypothetical protein